MEVVLLWHVRHARNLDGSIDHVDDEGELALDEEEGDDLKLLGVYSSERRAQERIERARELPGFADEPDCFFTSSCVVDEDQWADGFFTVWRGVSDG
ncbi:hypothetical protein [Allokutzneria sp. NRRL B-24872]|uniref:hypothetical protein n=1 Tax=Allokutzneria sp. NRRL B-24872 TaxID=1137961 RepID=UPI000A3CF2C9|nr:hypothetical protein [Allokutzneria sp. NRRL B-24872]